MANQPVDRHLRRLWWLLVASRVRVDDGAVVSGWLGGSREGLSNRPSGAGKDCSIRLPNRAGARVGDCAIAFADSHSSDSRSATHRDSLLWFASALGCWEGVSGLRRHSCATLKEGAKKPHPGKGWGRYSLGVRRPVYQTRGPSDRHPCPSARTRNGLPDGHGHRTPGWCGCGPRTRSQR